MVLGGDILLLPCKAAHSGLQAEIRDIWLSFLCVGSALSTDGKNRGFPHDAMGGAPKLAVTVSVEVRVTPKQATTLI